MNKKKIAFYTFGCRLNQSETASLKADLKQSGYNFVSPDNHPDIIVINSCSVTEKGDSEIKRLVHKIANMTPKTKIALIGCMAEAYKETLLQLPNVHWVIGNKDKMNLPVLLSQHQTISVDPPESKNFTIPQAPVDSRYTRANLKIQEGCNAFCSYCIIPYLRGIPRSREIEDILKEMKILLTNRYKEIVLTGINIGLYKDKEKNLKDVLQNLMDLPGEFRIRISSIEPSPVIYLILDEMEKSSRICNFLHIPLQSGSNPVLKKMNRNYSTEDFASLITKIVQRIPDAGLGTDIIVGFPGETDALFSETYTFIQNTPFSYLHVFSYSPRPYTESYKWPNRPSPETVKKRSLLLRKLSVQKRNSFMIKMQGTIRTVLFEQKKEGEWTGLTDNYLRVHVKSTLNLKNLLIPVKLEKIKNQKLYGSLLD